MSRGLMSNELLRGLAARCWVGYRTLAQHLISRQILADEVLSELNLRSPKYS
jgi:hypothetical protein